MKVSSEILRRSVEVIASTDGLRMDPQDLVEDVFLLAYAFPDADDFKAAVAATVRSIGLVRAHAVTSSALKYEFSGWCSFHFQHRVAQGARADCRLVYRLVDGAVEVKGFGHRRIPQDLYARLSADRTE